MKNIRYEKIMVIPGKGRADFRVSNANGISLFYDQKRRKLTHRVSFLVDGKNVSGGRYEDFGTALIVRDIMHYLLPYGRKRVRAYYSEISLQKMAIQRKRKDIGELLQYLKNKYDITLFKWAKNDAI